MPLIQHKQNPLQKWNINPLVKGIDGGGSSDVSSSLVQTVSSFASKIFPGLGSVIGGLMKHLDGCPDNFDKEQLYREETAKAKTWIFHFKNILKMPRFGNTLAKRLTYADRYYTYVTNHHNYRKGLVKCGNNKSAEAIKHEIAIQFLNHFRNKMKSIATYTTKRETYFDPLKARDVLTLDYLVYTLKPHVKLNKSLDSYLNEATTIKVGNNTSTNTSTSSSSDTQGKAYAPPTTSPPSKNGGGTMIAVAVIVALLFSKQLKQMFK